MANWTAYFLIIGVVIVVLSIMQQKNPTRVHKLGRIIVAFFVATAFWNLFDRVSTLGETLGYSWIWTLALILLGGFAAYWILTRPPME